jgi:lipopolysaccharide heptosyltransferase III
MRPVRLPRAPKILVIALRRLGDVLLTTPLIHSLRLAWPHATIDALVFADTSGILEGNPDLNGVVTMPMRPTAVQSLTLSARLWRRYDLAVSTQSGDRPTFFGVVAGRRRVAPAEQTFNGRVKRTFLYRSVPYVSGVHRVEEMLRLVDLLGIKRVPVVTCPRVRAVGGLPDGDYAVIHASPMFRYKQWTKEGWRALAASLAGRGLNVIATGGPSEIERRYLDAVWDGTAPVRRLDGKLDWPQLTGLLTKARVYIGPDTSVTHLAAAAGCPTVAIYGPTDPRLWGPWPAGGLDPIWEAAGKVQRRSNVWLVQNPLPCLPCQLEGCERRLESYSACLDELPSARVIEVVERVLGMSTA